MLKRSIADQFSKARLHTFSTYHVWAKIERTNSRICIEQCRDRTHSTVCDLIVPQINALNSGQSVQVLVERYDWLLTKSQSLEVQLNWILNLVQFAELLFESFGSIDWNRFSNIAASTIEQLDFEFFSVENFGDFRDE